MIGLSDRSKFGRVALVGPLTNLAMGFSFLFLSLFFSSYSPYFVVGASFNGWITLFNLIPFGVLDGQKIFEWNKLIWIITMATCFGIIYHCVFVISFFANAEFGPTDINVSSWNYFGISRLFF